MLRKIAVLLACLQLVHETMSVSCTSNSDCSYGGANCLCKCCLIGGHLSILGGTINLCIGGTVACCDNSGPTLQQCTNHTSPPTTKAPTTSPPTEPPTEPPTTLVPTSPPTCQDPSRACPRTECLDLFAGCASWAKLGYCSSNPERAEAMARNCPVSCGYCQEICEDYECPDICAARALAGDCTNDPEFMLVRCKKTCQYCDRCTNLHNACPFFEAQGFCTSTNPADADKYNMWFYCRASCGACTPSSECAPSDPLGLYPCPRDWAYSNLTNKCYWATPHVGSYATTINTCAQEGGVLVSIHSTEESDLFKEYFPTPPGVPNSYFYYIGLHANPTWANPTWVDGSPYDYQHWDLPCNAAGQQPNAGVGENYGAYTFNGNTVCANNGFTTGWWHDVGDGAFPGICQKELCEYGTSTTNAP